MIALGQEETGVPRAAVVVVLVKAAAKGVEEQEDKDGNLPFLSGTSGLGPSLHTRKFMNEETCLELLELGLGPDFADPQPMLLSSCEEFQIQGLKTWKKLGLQGNPRFGSS